MVFLSMRQQVTLHSQKSYFLQRRKRNMSHAEEYVDHTETTFSETEVPKPQLVTRAMVASAQAYMIRLLQFGAMEGVLGELALNPSLKRLIEAIHQVVAGGEVEVKLVEAGASQVVQELNSRLEQAITEGNFINKQVGYSLLPVS